MYLQRVLLIWTISMTSVDCIYLRFTNLKCNTFDPAFATFEKCDLKIVARGVVAANLHMKLHQLPLTATLMNIALLKKANGYRPFLYNTSVDLCAVVKNPKRYPFVKILWDSFLKYSNLNHSCPFNHDIIIRDIVLREDMFELLPLPAGDYLLELRMGSAKNWKLETKTYFYTADLNKQISNFNS